MSASCPSHQNSASELRQRPQRSVQVDATKRVPKLSQQRTRIAEFQDRWETIKHDLPPQLSRRHIGMISIGGVIGTGLFVGSASALQLGGPIGSLLGYSVMGSVVYCLCVSIGEIISFLPNVGGVVGLASIYVDRALGFSLGWAAWYEWAVTIPVEVTAAAVVVRFWDKCEQVNTSILITIFLVAAVFVNTFPSRRYGEMEFWFSFIKIITIVSLILLSLIIDFGASGTRYFFHSWKTPFAPNYYGVSGNRGRFLGFWGCIMQAAFAFFGSEVPGIAAGEVINATINVPRALRRVWLRITLFYVGGILVVGLFIPDGKIPNAKDPRCPNKSLPPAPQGTANGSPFVQIFKMAGWGGLAHLVNAAILISAWSAAASDVYISSRYLFFLARCHHAPAFLANLVRFDHSKRHPDYHGTDECTISPQSDMTPPIPLEALNPQSPDVSRSSRERTEGNRSSAEESMTFDGENDIEARPSGPVQPEPSRSDFIVPLASVFVSSSVGLIGFMSAKQGPDAVFTWLGNLTSVAALQAWTGMLFTYIRMYQGTVYTRKNRPGDPSIQRLEEHIKKHRHWGQPYLAWYAFVMCVLILLTNGWAVFLDDGWRIATQSDIIPPGNVVPRVSTFLSAYIPIPLFVLLTIGYKLVYQTEMVAVKDMSFDVKNIPEPDEEPEPKSRLVRWWYKII